MRLASRHELSRDLSIGRIKGWVFTLLANPRDEVATLGDGITASVHGYRIESPYRPRTKVQIDLDAPKRQNTRLLDWAKAENFA